MVRSRLSAVSLLVLLAACKGPTEKLQQQVSSGGHVQLPDGLVELKRPIVITPGVKNLDLSGGPGTVLRPAPEFQGAALILCRSCRNVKLRDFGIEGIAGGAQLPVEAAPADVANLRHFNSNGIVIDDGENIQISGIAFRDVGSFAIIGSIARKVKIENVSVTGGGSQNAKSKQNTSGGIVFEEGSNGVEVRNSRFEKISGNALWTAARPAALRNGNILFENNDFANIGHTAIHIGSANRVRILNNRIKLAGYPVELIDSASGSAPAAIGTSGKVDEGLIANNQIEEVNGYCFYLNGFHDGAVRGNRCINRGKPEDYPNGGYGIWFGNLFPEMRSQLNTIQSNVVDGVRLGGIFMIGGGHKIIGNKFLNLNRARCPDNKKEFGCNLMPDEPGVVRAGIFIGDKAERPDPGTDNLVESNEITGYRMKTNCIILADKVDLTANTVRTNTCADAVWVAPLPQSISSKGGTDEYQVFRPSELNPR